MLFTACLGYQVALAGGYNATSGATKMPTLNRLEPNAHQRTDWYASKRIMFRRKGRYRMVYKLEAGIAKHCLGSKIVDMHVCNFNNEICYTAKVPLQVTSAPSMLHPTTHRHHRNTPATAYELRSLNCNSVRDLASLAKGTAILTHRID